MRLRTQQLMIELADALERLLQLLIIVEPTANLGDTLTPYAELLRAPTGICHRQYEHLVSFATCTFRAPLGVPNGTLKQRAAQQFAGDRQLADKLVARVKSSISNHSQE